MMLHFFPLIFLGGLILLLGVLSILRITGKTFKLLIPAFLLGIYLLMVVGVTLFPIPIPMNFRYINFWEQIPIRSIQDQLHPIPIRGVVQLPRAGIRNGTECFIDHSIWIPAQFPVQSQLEKSIIAVG